MDYEEEHADDEDNVEPEELEDEDIRAAKVSIEPDAKAYLKPHTFIQARIKREQIAANKTNDAGVVEDDDDDDETLTREGRRMKRALQKQGLGYDSDDDESQNPYASEARYCPCASAFCSFACCRRKTTTTMASYSDRQFPNRLLSSLPHHLPVQVPRDRGLAHPSRILGPVLKSLTMPTHQRRRENPQLPMRR